MVLTIIVLDSEENFLQYLNPELIQITETNEQYSLRTVHIEYYVEGLKDYKNLFKIGNKIWISSDNVLSDCLYVINTQVENDLFDKNNVEFEAEEKLVELNYVFFTSSELITENGYTIDSKNAVTINYFALNKIFGKYFNIGIIQNCLSTYLQKVVIKGTMSLMELLRYIEEETGNVFIARYEKDALTNKIHCFLDFLNPKSTTKQWELHLFYSFPTDESDSATTAEISESEDIKEVDDMVYFPEYVSETPLKPSDLKFRLKYNKKILWEKGAVDLGFTGQDNLYEFIFQYKNNSLNISVNNKVNSNVFDGIIQNGSVFEIYDSVNKKVVYNYQLYPKLGETHEEVINLGRNVENIVYETNEEDTFIAIAPVLNSDDLDNNQLNTLINNWIGLSVVKGQAVPMIVQKRMVTGTETNPCTTLAQAYNILGAFNLGSNYYSRPIKPNDQENTASDGTQQNNSYEFWVGTAYWAAPFNKLPGELMVVDDNPTDVEYSHIQGNLDNLEEHTRVSTPKTGSVDTSDEDPYAIFNDVCMKLKDKRYPEINVTVDVANLRDGNFNDYEIFDKLYVKIPGFEKLVTAIVNKTEKNPLDIGENKVELTNYSVNKKVAQKRTEISSSPLSFTYPATGTVTARLINSEYDPDDKASDQVEFISDRLVTFTVYNVENESQTLSDKIYTKKTDANGYAEASLKLDPGNYVVDIQFGGDVEYASSNNEVKINVNGTIEVPQAVSTKKTTTITQATKVKRTYSKYGVSPNKAKDTIMAIGKLSTNDKKVNKKYYVTVFKRKCPDCGSTQLYWSIFWANNKAGNIDETSSVGIFPATGKKESGSNKGRIICKKCGHKWNVIGESLSKGKKLKIHKKTGTTTKAKAYELRNGNIYYDTIVKNVKVEKVLGNTGSEMSRSTSNTGKSYSGLLTKSVIEKAKNIVGNSTGIPAAKKIAKWIGTRISHETRAGLYQSPAATLSRKKGNCICQTDLFFHMCDAVGVTSKYKLYYIWVGEEKYGKRHFFAKINGKYVDVDSYPNNPWGHAGFGKRKIRKTTTYPELPLNRNYAG